MASLSVLPDPFSYGIVYRSKGLRGIWFTSASSEGAEPYKFKTKAPFLFRTIPVDPRLRRLNFASLDRNFCGTAPQSDPVCYPSPYPTVIIMTAI